MARTLLIGNPRTSWRDWMKERRGTSDVLVVDPADVLFGVPGRTVLVRGGRQVFSRFYGSLNPLRAPHVWLLSAFRAAELAGEDLLILAPPYRPSPLLRQSLHLLAESLKPDRIIIAEGTELGMNGFPTGPEVIEVGQEPAIVGQVQRRARWLEMFALCAEQEFDFRTVSFEGTRIGAGTVLTAERLARSGLEGILHAEVQHRQLLIVANAEPGDAAASRALDDLGCDRLTTLAPDCLNDLLCSVTREDGEDLGMGTVIEVDWARCRIAVRATCIPPIAARTLRIGGLRLTPQGDEVEEIRPWQV